MAYSEEFSEELLVDWFVDGLKEEIKAKVRLSSLKSVDLAFLLALGKELELEAKVFDKTLQCNLDDTCDIATNFSQASCNVSLPAMHQAQSISGLVIQSNKSKGEIGDNSITLKVFDKNSECANAHYYEDYEEYEKDDILLKDVFGPGGKKFDSGSGYDQDGNKTSSLVMSHVLSNRELFLEPSKYEVNFRDLCDAPEVCDETLKLENDNNEGTGESLDDIFDPGGKQLIMFPDNGSWHHLTKLRSGKGHERQELMKYSLSPRTEV